MAAAAMKPNKTWWIVGAIVAIAILFLFLKGRGSGVSTMAPQPSPASDPNALAGLSQLAQLAQQTEIETRREAAALEAATLNANTQVKLAGMQENAQTTSQIISVIGNIVQAAIPYALGSGRQAGYTSPAPSYGGGGYPAAGLPGL